jgi:hypothetical protein
MGLRSLQHIRHRRSTDRGRCLPATFRPQGFLTLSTVSSLRCLAGFVSRRRRSWDSPFGAFFLQQGTRYVSAREDPHTVSASAIPTAEAGGRHGSPRFLGFSPCRNPFRPATCLACRSSDAPLGFALLGYASGDLRQAFAQRPLARFAVETSPTAGTSEYRSVSARLLRASTENRERREQPFQGSCTWRILVTWASLPAGLCVHLTSGGTSLSTIDDLGPDP